MKTAIIVATLLMFAVPAVAVTYEWEDSQGTTNFTEDLGSIPKQYRKKVKVLGGEEEAAPAENDQGEVSGEPATVPEVKEKGKSAEQSTDLRKEQKKIYGGKSAEEWKKGFAEATWKVKNEEEQLNHLKDRMKDTSKMSRGEYLSIQMGINDSESRLQEYRRTLDTMTSEANRAGVPSELRGQ